VELQERVNELWILNFLIDWLLLFVDGALHVLLVFEFRACCVYHLCNDTSLITGTINVINSKCSLGRI